MQPIRRTRAGKQKIGSAAQSVTFLLIGSTYLECSFCKAIVSVKSGVQSTRRRGVSSIARHHLSWSVFFVNDDVLVFVCGGWDLDHGARLTSDYGLETTQSTKKLGSSATCASLALLISRAMYIGCLSIGEAEIEGLLKSPVGQWLVTCWPICLPFPSRTSSRKSSIGEAWVRAVAKLIQRCAQGCS